MTVRLPDWIAPRSAWLDGSGLPWYGTSPTFRWDLLTHLVAHWPGWERDRHQTVDTDARALAHARRIHRGTLADRPDRPYDHEYNFSLATHGLMVEGRGVDYRDAAAGPPKGVDSALTWPIHTLSVQFPLGWDQPLTAAQIATARRFHAWASEQAGRRLVWEVHGRIRLQLYPTTALDGRWHTTCPGPTIARDVLAGALDSTDTPIVTPPPEDDMATAFIYRDARYANEFLLGAGSIVNVTSAMKDGPLNAVPFLEDTHDQALESIVLQLGYASVDHAVDAGFLVPR